LRIVKDRFGHGGLIVYRMPRAPDGQFSIGQWDEGQGGSPFAQGGRLRCGFLRQEMTEDDRR
jgi:hypothetical protein